ncbi:hypothetical protein V5O48_006968 [Marasmius crinis-equi]|uniref:Uncharacterized protein n=1 Tax=Marasmius crinis-equi TaxID=585013 RepID=A0ABR3FIS5_9AGAR
MAYKLVHPYRVVTQRQEFWQRSQPPLPTQSITARRHFTEDSYIQASWRGNEATLTGSEFFQRLKRNQDPARHTNSTQTMHERIREEITPTSPTITPHARSLEVVHGDLFGESADDESNEAHIAHLLVRDLVEKMADETSRSTPTPETETNLLEAAAATSIPKPKLQRYKNGQFPLTSLKTQYQWSDDTYKRVQKRCKELVPTYFNPRRTWIRQTNREQSEGWMCETMTREFPFLAEYEGCWPVRHFIRRILQGTSGKAKRKREE